MMGLHGFGLAIMMNTNAILDNTPQNNLNIPIKLGDTLHGIMLNSHDDWFIQNSVV